ncbi:glycine-rich domain-containing protein [Cupriavidus basilensis]
MKAQDQTVEHMWQAIDALDFSRMKAKLLHRKRVRWTAETLAAAESGYRQFLKLAAKYPDAPVVPSELVDEFWHAHILDTQHYASDCERIFGHVLHHDPYVGIDGTEDEAKLQALANASNALSMQEFGQHLAAPSVCTRAAPSEPANCARGMRAEAAYGTCAISTEPAYCALTATAGAAYCALAVTANPAYCARPLPVMAAYGAVANKPRASAIA